MVPVHAGTQAPLSCQCLGVVDDQDRLLSYGPSTYAYTGNGELKLKVTGTDSTKYRYDALGNLRDVYLPSGDHIEYVIDAQQRRIGRKLNGTLQKGWLYQSQLAIAAEVDASGAVTKTFEYASHGNVPDWMYANGMPYRIVTDHLGSVRLVVDVNGTVAQRIDYDAYGRVLTNTSPGFQPFGYAGGLLDDATGLTRFGARDYDAEAGRWLAKDPVSFFGGSSNLYEYAAGEPVLNEDPSGQWWVVAVVGGVLTFVAERTHGASFQTALLAGGVAFGAGIVNPLRASSIVLELTLNGAFSGLLNAAVSNVRCLLSSDRGDRQYAVAAIGEGTAIGAALGAFGGSVVGISRARAAVSGVVESESIRTAFNRAGEFVAVSSEGLLKIINVFR
jgi:RHS repeat-associated protein